RSLTSVLYFHDPSPTAPYTLSLHDALPISERQGRRRLTLDLPALFPATRLDAGERQRIVRTLAEEEGTLPFAARLGLQRRAGCRSEEHTSELQSRENLVCRLLLEKKNTKHA